MYPHFKVGEIWTEIKQELTEEVLLLLKQKQVKPTSDDQHWMMTQIEEF
jgi:hypothetical protein